MFTILNRIRQAKMFAISHRLGDVDCMLRTLEEKHCMGDVSKLLAALDECAHDADIQWTMPEKDDARAANVARVLAVNAAILLYACALEGGGEVSSLLLTAGFVTLVLNINAVMNSKKTGKRTEGQVIRAAQAEAWLMAHATEARMLHARRSLYLLISCGHHFSVTQDEAFNKKLHESISMYLYLLRYAEEHPQWQHEIQRFVSASLPKLVTTVLNTRMHNTDRDVQTEYAAACCCVMRNVRHKGGRLIFQIRTLEKANDTGVRGMAASFYEMGEHFVRDGLIDRNAAEAFAADKSIISSP